MLSFVLILTCNLCSYLNIFIIKLLDTEHFFILPYYAANNLEWRSNENTCLIQRIFDM